MTVLATGLPARRTRARFRPAWAPPARLLRLELRRGPMMWMAPLIALLFWFDTYRSSMAMPALWQARLLYLQDGKQIPDFAPLVVAAAAWAGSRDRRRHLSDQVAIAPLPQWSARLATWAATTAWAVAVYAGCVGALYLVTAAQGAAGSPVWWPAVTGAAAVAALTSLGFAAGAWFPGRFTAPLAAVTVTAALLVLYKMTSSVAGGYLLISPLVSPLSPAAPNPQWGLFYPYQPGLRILQLILLAGVVSACAGSLGLRPRRAERMRGAAVVTAAVVTIAGVAAASAATSLAGTARVGAHGVDIPALGGGAARPAPSTLACGHAAGVPVCLNPVYRSALPAVTSALAPVLAEVARLPGAPVSVTQVASNGQGPGVVQAAVGGEPPVLRLGVTFAYQGIVCPDALFGRPVCASAAQLWSDRPVAVAMLRSQAGGAIIDDVVGHASPAQRAVSAGLLSAAGAPVSGRAASSLPPKALTTGTVLTPGTPLYAAAERFARLPAASRHAWLAARLAALRAGRITLKEVP